MLSDIALIADIAKEVTSSSGDISDAVKDSIESLRMMNQPSSLSRKAKQGVYEFPFLISSSLSNNLDEVVTIIKALECEFSNLILLSMGLNPSADSKVNINIQKTLSRFVSNESSEYNFDTENDVIDVSFEAAPKSPKSPSLTQLTEDINNSPDNKKIIQSQLVQSDKNVLKKYSQSYNSTIIVVTLRIGETSKSEIKIPIGIKGVPHYLPSDEMIYVLKSFINPRSETFMTRFIRWRSGEIRGLHNLILRVDDIRRDTEFDRRVGTNSSWLKVLKSRGASRKFNTATSLLSKHFKKDSNISTREILPNCSFILSLSDVDMLEQETGINLFTNPIAASKFLDDAMGLSLVIYDDTHDILHILYSGYTKYESHASQQAKTSISNDMTNALINVLKRS